MIPATALRPSHDDESAPISAVADGGRDVVELVDEAIAEPTVRCTVCDELVDVRECHSRSAVIERLREHRDADHGVDVGDGIETDGGRDVGVNLRKHAPLGPCDECGRIRRCRPVDGVGYACLGCVPAGDGDGSLDEIVASSSPTAVATDGGEQA